MTGREVWRAFVLARTSVGVLVALSVALLAMVAVPQLSVLGPEQYVATLDAGGPLARFALQDLGLGDLPTQPALPRPAGGLLRQPRRGARRPRIGPTWRRMALRPLNEKGLRAWARLEESLQAPLPADWSAGHAGETLRGFGYRVRRPVSGRSGASSTARPHSASCSSTSASS